MQKEAAEEAESERVVLASSFSSLHFLLGAYGRRLPDRRVGTPLPFTLLQARALVPGAMVDRPHCGFSDFRHFDPSLVFCLLSLLQLQSKPATKPF